MDFLGNLSAEKANFRGRIALEKCLSYINVAITSGRVFEL